MLRLIQILILSSVEGEEGIIDYESTLSGVPEVDICHNNNTVQVAWAKRERGLPSALATSVSILDSSINIDVGPPNLPRKSCHQPERSHTVYHPHK